MTLLASYSALWPELFVAVSAMALLMLGVFRPDTEATGRTIGWLAILVLIAAGWLVLTQKSGTSTLFDNGFIVDGFGRFMKLLVLAASAVALLLAFDDFADTETMKFEYPVLILLATAGMLMMISANDLIALYLGLELQSLALYVVAAFRRDSVRSSEAGLKYFVLGALSSGMLLYGASLVYGFTGSTNFQVIAGVAKGKAMADNIGLIIGLVFVLVGLAFKLSAVPFHMWAPDVYEGAPTPVTAFFAAAPKAAAMALLVRVVLGAFPGAAAQWQQVISLMAIASMGLGAFAAIGQTNIKRLMAYSSIANVGFALVGLAANSVEGVQGVLVYMAIYIVMTLGTFACILAMRRDSGPVEDISELSGLSQTNLPLAAALAALMFSLAGIPPMAGFFAKFYAFLPVMKAGLYPLAVIGVIASVIGAYYYLRIVKVMFFDEAKAPFAPVRVSVGAVIAASALFVILFVAPFIAAPIVDAAEAAARSFRL
jgi:NADH-quinone oxidoreductase subunit N